jgi:arginyl-tRNA synthetase
LLRKAATENITIEQAVNISTTPEQEKTLLRILYDYPSTVIQAGIELSPALIANYTYELVKAYNHFYQDSPILWKTDTELRIFRIQLSLYTAKIIKQSMGLLGIDVPEQM